MVNFPTGSAQWSRIARNLPSDRTQTLNRFTARLRVAYLYDGLKIEGFSTETIRGYEALFSVFLSYTAFELLWAGMAEYMVKKKSQMTVTILKCMTRILSQNSSLIEN
jgi:hypothetical protein